MRVVLFLDQFRSVLPGDLKHEDARDCGVVLSVLLGVYLEQEALGFGTLAGLSVFQ